MVGVGSSATFTLDNTIVANNGGGGSMWVSACPHGIPSGTAVDIAFIIQAVNNALDGCPAEDSEAAALPSREEIAFEARMG